MVLGQHWFLACFTIKFVFTCNRGCWHNFRIQSMEFNHGWNYMDVCGTWCVLDLEFQTVCFYSFYFSLLSFPFLTFWSGYYDFPELSISCVFLLLFFIVSFYLLLFQLNKPVDHLIRFGLKILILIRYRIISD